MFKKPLSVQQLLMWGFLLTALLPMLTVMWLAFYQARSALREEITRDMQTRATAAFNEVDIMMFERLQNMVSWSRLEVMHEVVIGDIDKRLSNFLSEIKNSYRGVYQTLYVVNNQNIIVASSEPAQIGKQASILLPAKSPWKEVQFATHAIHFEKIQQQHLPMAIAIKDADSKKMGTLWVWFDWNYISAILKNTEIKGSSAALLDEYGNELAYTE
ncbi:MAG: cache domain-containing protein, partial [Methylotenera sp.]|nr:cache domain-containing protein [Methylotenera sp.]